MIIASDACFISLKLELLFCTRIANLWIRYLLMNSIRKKR